MESRRRTQELEERWSRAWWVAMLASLLLHVLLFLLFSTGIVEPPSPFSAAGPRAGDDQAAAGGGMQAVAMRIALPEAPQPIPRPPEPIPTPSEVVEPEPEPVIEPAVATQPDAEIGPITEVATSGRGNVDKGPGIEGGTGRGDGGTSEEGLFRLVPPSPRGLILPPSNRPGGVRGKEVAVWVFVSDRGRVVADSTRVLPSTGDRSFDRKLRDQASEWVFEPARQAGRPVAEWFRYTIIL